MHTSVPIWQHSKVRLVSLVDFLSMIRGAQAPKQTKQRKVVNEGRKVSGVQWLAASPSSDLIVEDSSIDNSTKLLQEANSDKSISGQESKCRVVKFAPKAAKTSFTNLGFIFLRVTVSILKFKEINK